MRRRFMLNAQAQRLMAVTTATIGPNPRKPKVQRSLSSHHVIRRRQQQPAGQPGRPQSGAWRSDEFYERGAEHAVARLHQPHLQVVEGRQHPRLPAARSHRLRDDGGWHGAQFHQAVERHDVRCRRDRARPRRHHEDHHHQALRHLVGPRRRRHGRLREAVEYGTGTSRFSGGWPY